jgi:hypothetical protein
LQIVPSSSKREIKKFFRYHRVIGETFCTRDFLYAEHLQGTVRLFIGGRDTRNDVIPTAEAAPFLELHVLLGMVRGRTRFLVESDDMRRKKPQAEAFSQLLHSFVAGSGETVALVIRAL